jgi:hypothetical protein
MLRPVDRLKINPQPEVERRTGADRRQVELGAPNGQERRRGLEPRKVDVQEVDLTLSDWALFEAGTPLKPKQPPPA